METVRCVFKSFRVYQCFKCVNFVTANTVNRSVRYNKIISSSVVSRFPFFYNKFKSNCGHNRGVLLCFSLGFLDFFREKELDPESELILTLKRSILLIQREEFNAAEQMLHIALKQAQEQRHVDGITYAYDLMANLAFTTGEYDKAEKLFVVVMNRLMTKNVPEDDLRNLHISLKLAKIFQEKKESSKAEVGFNFCRDHLERKVEVIRNRKSGSADLSDEEKLQNENTLALFGMTLDWYAKFLLEQHKFDESIKCFKKAYKLCVILNGDIHEQSVVLLNDLGTAHHLKGNYEKALKYLNRAVDVGKHLPNMEDLSAVYVNLGKVYLEKGMKDEAEKHCRNGWKNAHRLKNIEGIADAESCLSKIKIAAA